MKRTLAALALSGMLALVVPLAAADINVHVEGAVAQTGTLQLPDGARISAAALAAQTRPDAYFLGAAWLRPSLLKQQTRDKAGVLFDVGFMHRQALLHGNAPLAATLRAMQQWIESLPVTGRSVAALLDPRVVEATPKRNWPLAAGDVLFYPLRPTTVQVVGAVMHPCKLPLQPLAGTRHYLAGCQSSAVADTDWAWVIQPDGRTFRLGVALWNQSAPLPLAPGAIIYVPFNAYLTRHVDAHFNHDLATFLATQTLPEATP